MTNFTISMFIGPKVFGERWSKALWLANHHLKGNEVHRVPEHFNNNMLRDERAGIGEVERRGDLLQRLIRIFAGEMHNGCDFNANIVFRQVEFFLKDELHEFGVFSPLKTVHGLMSGRGMTMISYSGHSLLTRGGGGGGGDAVEVD